MKKVERRTKHKNISATIERITPLLTRPANKSKMPEIAKKPEIAETPIIIVCSFDILVNDKNNKVESPK